MYLHIIKILKVIVVLYCNIPTIKHTERINCVDCRRSCQTVWVCVSSCWSAGGALSLCTCAFFWLAPEFDSCILSAQFYSRKSFPPSGWRKSLSFLNEARNLNDPLWKSNFLHLDQFWSLTSARTVQRVLEKSLSLSRGSCITELTSFLWAFQGNHSSSRLIF